MKSRKILLWIVLICCFVTCLTMIYWISTKETVSGPQSLMYLLVFLLLTCIMSESLDRLKSLTIAPTKLLIWGHPCLGKTEAKDDSKFLDWDDFYNEKRDQWLKEHNLTKDVLANYKDYPEYLQFLDEKWEEFKELDSPIKIASACSLLELYSKDFDFIINIPKLTFIRRNMDRGGEYVSTVNWKNHIDSLIEKSHNFIITTDEYWSQIIRNYDNRRR